MPALLIQKDSGDAIILYHREDLLKHGWQGVVPLFAVVCIIEDMKIWVDADACPVAVKDIIVHASHRRKIDTVFVANKDMLVPVSPLIAFVRVASTPDAADQYIQSHAESGDMVVTQDIPLAHMLVAMNVVVINPRGEKYTPENIGERLSIRDFMQERRERRCYRRTKTIR